MEICAMAHSRQLLVVEAADHSTSKAVLALWEHCVKEGVWRSAGTMAAAIGKHGMTDRKKEGDGKTPIGRFRLGTGFGTDPAPVGKWPYIVAGPHDYWVDDPESDDYNTWVRYEGDPARRWRSFERLAIEPYALAAVIRYNEDPFVKGKGSAIFFHVWGGPDSHSAGCVTVAKDDVRRVLSWLDPVAQPVIAIGTSAELRQLVPPGLVE